MIPTQMREHLYTPEPRKDGGSLCLISYFYKNGQISESLALGIFLTLAGGFQDAYSYNVRDHVFANAQTGNIVLLGQNLASGNLMHALRYLLPLAAFFLGVYLTEWIKHFYKTSVKIH